MNRLIITRKAHRKGRNIRSDPVYFRYVECRKSSGTCSSNDVDLDDDDDDVEDGDKNKGDDDDKIVK